MLTTVNPSAYVYSLGFCIDQKLGKAQIRKPAALIENLRMVLCLSMCNLLDGHVGVATPQSVCGFSHARTLVENRRLNRPCYVF